MSLEARNLAFTYPCGTQILSDFTLRIDPGERVALTGSSGVGKTTLCRLLAGYLVPSAGGVFIDGQELPVITSLKGRPSSVQLLWQHPEQAFDPQLKLGKSMCEATNLPGFDIEEFSLLKASLSIDEQWLDRYPHELSGGELMRLAVLRALAVQPHYLIADEATAMLDMVTQAQVWQTLLDCQQRHNMGIGLVSHSPSLVAKVATRSVTLR